MIISGLPSLTQHKQGFVPVYTDGEKVKLDKEWVSSYEAASRFSETIHQGAGNIPVEVPGTCLIIQNDPAIENSYTLVMIDPGYLAPTGVETVIVMLHLLPHS